MKDVVMRMKLSEIKKHIEVLKDMESLGVKLNQDIKDYFYTLVEVQKEFSIEKTIEKDLTR